MIRIVALAFVGAIIGGAVTHSSAGAVAGFLLVGGVLVFAVMSGRPKLRCSFCRKRVKIGAAACHHCGRIVSTQ